MAISVNPPPQIRLPKLFADDAESRTYFRHLDRMFLQLWRRTGGSVDLVDENEQSLTSTGSRVSRNAAKINALELTNFEVVNTSIDYTTQRNDIVICNNSSSITITLDTNALEGDQVHIKRKDAVVVVSGLVDGNLTTNINVLNYSMHLAFDGTEWSQI